MNEISIYHIVIASLFVLCTVVQLWCAIYFFKKKDLNKKWLYIISSFLGFPVGLHIIWATGALSLGIGIKIPAVLISVPFNAPGMWSMGVYFPVGLIFLIKEKKKDQRLVMAPQIVNEDIKQ